VNRYLRSGTARDSIRIRRLPTMYARYHASTPLSADDPGILSTLAKYFSDGAWSLVRFDLVSSLLFG
jgi:hypothetical protein